MVVLDTNLIIDHTRALGKQESTLFRLWQKYGREQLFLSIISIQELYQGLSTRRQDREDLMLSVISQFNILPYTYATAKLAGEVFRDNKVTITFADAAIAATTIDQGYKLATLNTKDFKSIPNLELLDIKN